MLAPPPPPLPTRAGPPRATGQPSPPTSAPTATARPLLHPVKSHQTGTIESHWNDLPPSFLSRTPSPCLPTASSVTSDFVPLLKTLFETTPSTLAAREKTQCHARILKCLDAITEPQRMELAGYLRRVLEREETPQWGRERVVEFMMREPGVAGWAAGVRRGVEGVKWDEE